MGGANPSLWVACKLSLQYDGGGGADSRFELRVGTWNVVSLSRKGGDVCEELRKIDVCCSKDGEGRVQGCWG